MTTDNEALPPLPDLCSITKPLADFPEPVAYINMKTGQVKSLATLNREKPPGQWWPFNLQEQIRAALSASPQAPAAQPVAEFMGVPAWKIRERVAETGQAAADALRDLYAEGRAAIAAAPSAQPKQAAPISTLQLILTPVALAGNAACFEITVKSNGTTFSVGRATLTAVDSCRIEIDLKGT